MTMTTKSLVVLIPALLWHSLAIAVEPPPRDERPKGRAIDVAKLYAASGWMGDGEKGTQFVNVNEACVEDPKTPPTCLKISYTVGPQEWAGAYWLNKPNNWGDKAGEDLSKLSYSKVSFWAKGDKGTEVIEFKAGGVDSNEKTYKDSFAVTSGKVRLEKDWHRYELDLTGQNLSSVIGFFCWVAAGTANPTGCTFYLDDIQYE